MAFLELANREVCNVHLYKYTDNSPFMYIDYANISTQEHKATTNYAYAGQGHARAVQFVGSPEDTMKLTSQVITPEFISLLSGSDIVSGANLFHRELITSVTADTTTTITFPVDKTPVASTVYIYPSGSDCVSSAKVEGTLASNVFTFTTPATEDSSYICYWQSIAAETNQTIRFLSNKFPQDLTLVGDTVWKSRTGVLVPAQVHAYHAVPQPNFTMTMQSSGDPGNFEITFDLLENDSNNMDMIEETA